MKKFFLFIMCAVVLAAMPATASAAASLDTLQATGSTQLSIVGTDLDLGRYIRISTNGTTLKYFRPGCNCGVNDVNASVTWNSDGIVIDDPALSGKLVRGVTILTQKSANSTVTTSVTKTANPMILMGSTLESISSSADGQITLTGTGLETVNNIAVQTDPGVVVYNNPTSAVVNPASVTINNWSDTEITLTDIAGLGGETLEQVEAFNANKSTADILDTQSLVVLPLPQPPYQVTHNGCTLTINGPDIHTYTYFGIAGSFGTMDNMTDSTWWGQITRSQDQVILKYTQSTIYGWCLGTVTNITAYRPSPYAYLTITP